MLDVLDNCRMVYSVWPFSWNFVPSEVVSESPAGTYGADAQDSRHKQYALRGPLAFEAAKLAASCFARRLWSARAMNSSASPHSFDVELMTIVNAFRAASSAGRSPDRGSVASGRKAIYAPSGSTRSGCRGRS